MKSPNISEEQVLQQRKEIGARLKILREERNLTMEELADSLGINKSTISKIEAGKWNFGVDTLIILSQELEFDIDLI